MKAKSRRRLLISSVAMLLVAMLALGTATFAWFTTNSKATASGITAKTTKASNILVSETGNNGTWKDSIVFQNHIVSTSMNPVTTPDFSEWKTTKAAEYDGAIPAANATYTDAVNGTDYTGTELHVKYENADDTAKQKVKITCNITPGSNTKTNDFLRVALVPKNTSAQGLKDGNTTVTAVVWGTAADDYATDRTNMAKTDGSGKSLVTTDQAQFYASVELTANTDYSFDVFVWYEGTDPDCIDSNSDNDYTVSFDVEKAA